MGASFIEHKLINFCNSMFLGKLVENGKVPHTFLSADKSVLQCKLCQNFWDDKDLEDGHCPNCLTMFPDLASMGSNYIIKHEQLDNYLRCKHCKGLMKNPKLFCNKCNKMLMKPDKKPKDIVVPSIWRKNYDEEQDFNYMIMNNRPLVLRCLDIYRFFNSRCPTEDSEIPAIEKMHKYNKMENLLTIRKNLCRYGSIVNWLKHDATVTNLYKFDRYKNRRNVFLTTCSYCGIQNLVSKDVCEAKENINSIPMHELQSLVELKNITDPDEFYTRAQATLNMFIGAYCGVCGSNLRYHYDYLVPMEHFTKELIEYDPAVFDDILGLSDLLKMKYSDFIDKCSESNFNNIRAHDLNVYDRYFKGLKSSYISVPSNLTDTELIDLAEQYPGALLQKDLNMNTQAGNLYLTLQYLIKSNVVHNTKLAILGSVVELNHMNVSYVNPVTSLKRRDSKLITLDEVIDFDIVVIDFGFQDLTHVQMVDLFNNNKLVYLLSTNYTLDGFTHGEYQPVNLFLGKDDVAYIVIHGINTGFKMSRFIFNLTYLDELQDPFACSLVQTKDRIHLSKIVNMSFSTALKIRCPIEEDQFSIDKLRRNNVFKMILEPQMGGYLTINRQIIVKLICMQLSGTNNIKDLLKTALLYTRVKVVVGKYVKNRISMKPDDLIAHVALSRLAFNQLECQTGGNYLIQMVGTFIKPLNVTSKILKKIQSIVASIPLLDFNKDSLIDILMNDPKLDYREVYGEEKINSCEHHKSCQVQHILKDKTCICCKLKYTDSYYCECCKPTVYIKTDLGSAFIKGMAKIVDKLKNIYKPKNVVKPISNKPEKFKNAVGKVDVFKDLGDFVSEDYLKCLRSGEVKCVVRGMALEIKYQQFGISEVKCVYNSLTEIQLEDNGIDCPFTAMNYYTKEIYDVKQYKKDINIAENMMLSLNEITNLYLAMNQNAVIFNDNNATIIRSNINDTYYPFVLTDSHIAPCMVLGAKIHSHKLIPKEFDQNIHMKFLNNATYNLLTCSNQEYVNALVAYFKTKNVTFKYGPYIEDNKLKLEMDNTVLAIDLKTNIEKLSSITMPKLDLLNTDTFDKYKRMDNSIKSIKQDVMCEIYNIIYEMILVQIPAFTNKDTRIKRTMACSTVLEGNLVHINAKEHQGYKYLVKTGDLIYLEDEKGDMRSKFVRVKGKKMITDVTNLRNFHAVKVHILKVSFASMFVNLRSLILNMNRCHILENILLNKVEYTKGLPGTGKTMTVLDLELTKNSIACALGTGAQQRLQDLVRTKARVNVYSLEKMKKLDETQLINADYIIIDEICQTKIVDLIFLCACKNLKKLYTFGDPQQVVADSYYTRPINVNIKHSMYEISAIKYLTEVRRFGGELFKAYNKLVPEAINACNYESTFEYISVPSKQLDKTLTDVSHDANIVLTFTTNTMNNILDNHANLTVNKVATVQGQEWDNVVIVQKEGDNGYGVGLNLQHVVTALSRAKLKVVWINAYKKLKLQDWDDLVNHVLNVPLDLKVMLLKYGEDHLIDVLMSLSETLWQPMLNIFKKHYGNLFELSLMNDELSIKNKFGLGSFTVKLGRTGEPEMQNEGFLGPQIQKLFTELKAKDIVNKLPINVDDCILAIGDNDWYLIAKKIISFYKEFSSVTNGILVLADGFNTIYFNKTVNVLQCNDKNLTKDVDYILNNEIKGKAVNSIKVNNMSFSIDEVISILLGEDEIGLIPQAYLQPEDWEAIKDSIMVGFYHDRVFEIKQLVDNQNNTKIKICCSDDNVLHLIDQIIGKGINLETVTNNMNVNAIVDLFESISVAMIKNDASILNGRVIVYGGLSVLSVFNNSTIIRNIYKCKYDKLSYAYYEDREMLSNSYINNILRLNENLGQFKFYENEPKGTYLILGLNLMTLNLEILERLLQNGNIILGVILTDPNLSDNEYNLLSVKSGSNNCRTLYTINNVLPVLNINLTLDDIMSNSNVELIVKYEVSNALIVELHKKETKVTHEIKLMENSIVYFKVLNLNIKNLLSDVNKEELIGLPVGYYRQLMYAILHYDFNTDDIKSYIASLMDSATLTKHGLSYRPVSNIQYMLTILPYMKIGMWLILNSNILFQLFKVASNDKIVVTLVTLLLPLVNKLPATIVAFIKQLINKIVDKTDKEVELRHIIEVIMYIINKSLEVVHVIDRSWCGTTGESVIEVCKDTSDAISNKTALNKDTPIESGEVKQLGNEGANGMDILNDIFDNLQANGVDVDAISKQALNNLNTQLEKESQKDDKQVGVKFSEDTEHDVDNDNEFDDELNLRPNNKQSKYKKEGEINTSSRNLDINFKTQVEPTGYDIESLNNEIISAGGLFYYLKNLEEYIQPNDKIKLASLTEIYLDDQCYIVTELFRNGKLVNDRIVAIISTLLRRKKEQRNKASQKNQKISFKIKQKNNFINLKDKDTSFKKLDLTFTESYWWSHNYVLKDYQSINLNEISFIGNKRDIDGLWWVNINHANDIYNELEGKLNLMKDIKLTNKQCLLGLTVQDIQNLIGHNYNHHCIGIHELRAISDIMPIKEVTDYMLVNEKSSCITKTFLDALKGTKLHKTVHDSLKEAKGLQKSIKEIVVACQLCNNLIATTGQQKLDDLTEYMVYDLNGKVIESLSAARLNSVISTKRIEVNIQLLQSYNTVVQQSAKNLIVFICSIKTLKNVTSIFLPGGYYSTLVNFKYYCKVVVVDTNLLSKDKTKLQNLLGDKWIDKLSDVDGNAIYITFEEELALKYNEFAVNFVCLNHKIKDVFNNILQNNLMVINNRSADYDISFYGSEYVTDKMEQIIKDFQTTTGLSVIKKVVKCIEVKRIKEDKDKGKCLKVALDKYNEMHKTKFATTTKKYQTVVQTLLEAGMYLVLGSNTKDIKQLYMISKLEQQFVRGNIVDTLAIEKLDSNYHAYYGQFKIMEDNIRETNNSAIDLLSKEYQLKDNIRVAIEQFKLDKLTSHLTAVIKNETIDGLKIKYSTGASCQGFYRINKGKLWLVGHKQNYTGKYCLLINGAVLKIGILCYHNIAQANIIITRDNEFVPSAGICFILHFGVLNTLGVKVNVQKQNIFAYDERNKKILKTIFKNEKIDLMPKGKLAKDQCVFMEFFDNYNHDDYKIEDWDATYMTTDGIISREVMLMLKESNHNRIRYIINEGLLYAYYSVEEANKLIYIQSYLINTFGSARVLGDKLGVGVASISLEELKECVDTKLVAANKSKEYKHKDQIDITKLFIEGDATSKSVEDLVNLNHLSQFFKKSKICRLNVQNVKLFVKPYGLNEDLLATSVQDTFFNPKTMQIFYLEPVIGHGPYIDIEENKMQIANTSMLNRYKNKIKLMFGRVLNWLDNLGTDDERKPFKVRLLHALRKQLNALYTNRVMINLYYLINTGGNELYRVVAKYFSVVDLTLSFAVNRAQMKEIANDVLTIFQQNNSYLNVIKDIYKLCIIYCKTFNGFYYTDKIVNLLLSCLKPWESTTYAFVMIIKVFINLINLMLSVDEVGRYMLAKDDLYIQLTNIFSYLLLSFGHKKVTTTTSILALISSISIPINIAYFVNKIIKQLNDEIESDENFCYTEMCTFEWQEKIDALLNYFFKESADEQKSVVEVNLQEPKVIEKVIINNNYKVLQHIELENNVIVPLDIELKILFKLGNGMTMLEWLSSKLDLQFSKDSTIVLSKDKMILKQIVNTRKHYKYHLCDNDNSVDIYIVIIKPAKFDQIVNEEIKQQVVKWKELNFIPDNIEVYYYNIWDGKLVDLCDKSEANKVQLFLIQQFFDIRELNCCKLLFKRVEFMDQRLIELGNIVNICMTARWDIIYDRSSQIYYQIIVTKNIKQMFINFTNKMGHIINNKFKSMFDFIDNFALSVKHSFSRVKNTYSSVVSSDAIQLLKYCFSIYNNHKLNSFVGYIDWLIKKYELDKTEHIKDLLFITGCLIFACINRMSDFGNNCKASLCKILNKKLALIKELVGEFSYEIVDYLLDLRGDTLFFLELTDVLVGNVLGYDEPFLATKFKDLIDTLSKCYSWVKANNWMDFIKSLMLSINKGSECVKRTLIGTIKSIKNVSTNLSTIAVLSVCIATKAVLNKFDMSMLYTHELTELNKIKIQIINAMNMNEELLNIQLNNATINTNEILIKNDRLTTSTTSWLINVINAVKTTMLKKLKLSYLNLKSSKLIGQINHIFMLDEPKLTQIVNFIKFYVKLTINQVDKLTNKFGIKLKLMRVNKYINTMLSVPLAHIEKVYEWLQTELKSKRTKNSAESMSDILDLSNALNVNINQLCDQSNVLEIDDITELNCTHVNLVEQAKNIKNKNQIQKLINKSKLEVLIGTIKDYILNIAEVVKKFKLSDINTYIKKWISEILIVLSNYSDLDLVELNEQILGLFFRESIESVKIILDDLKFNELVLFVKVIITSLMDFQQSCVNNLKKANLKYKVRKMLKKIIVKFKRIVLSGHYIKELDYVFNDTSLSDLAKLYKQKPTIINMRLLFLNNFNQWEKYKRKYRVNLQFDDEITLIPFDFKASEIAYENESYIIYENNGILTKLDNEKYIRKRHAAIKKSVVQRCYEALIAKLVTCKNSFEQLNIKNAFVKVQTNVRYAIESLIKLWNCYKDKDLLAAHFNSFKVFMLVINTLKLSKCRVDKFMQLIKLKLKLYTNKMDNFDRRRLEDEVRMVMFDISEGLNYESMITLLSPLLLLCHCLNFNFTSEILLLLNLIKTKLYHEEMIIEGKQEAIRNGELLIECRNIIIFIDLIKNLIKKMFCNVVVQFICKIPFDLVSLKYLDNYLNKNLEENVEKLSWQKILDDTTIILINESDDDVHEDIRQIMIPRDKSIIDYIAACCFEKLNVIKEWTLVYNKMVLDKIDSLKLLVQDRFKVYSNIIEKILERVVQWANNSKCKRIPLKVKQSDVIIKQLNKQTILGNVSSKKLKNLKCFSKEVLNNTYVRLTRVKNVLCDLTLELNNGYVATTIQDVVYNKIDHMIYEVEPVYGDVFLLKWMRDAINEQISKRKIKEFTENEYLAVLNGLSMNDVCTPRIKSPSGLGECGCEHCKPRFTRSKQQVEQNIYSIKLEDNDYINETTDYHYFNNLLHNIDEDLILHSNMIHKLKLYSKTLHLGTIKKCVLTKELPDISKPAIPKRAVATINAYSRRVANILKFQKYKLDTRQEAIETARTFFVKNFNQMSTYYRDNPVGFNFKETMEWFKEHPNPDIKQNQLVEWLKKFQNIKSFTDIKTFAKLESFPKFEQIDTKNEVSERVIMGHAYFVAALFAPVFNKIKKRLKESLGNKFYYVDGLTEEEVEQIYNSIHYTGDEWLFEDDASKQDRQTTMDLINIEYYIYNMLGLSDLCAELFKQIHVNWKSYSNNFRMLGHAMRITGSATTSLGNAIVNMIIHRHLIQDNYNNLKICTFLGDDHHAIYKSKVNTNFHNRMSRFKYNMETKSKCSKVVSTMLQHLVFFDEQGHVHFEPNVVRLSGRIEMMNTSHTEDEIIYLRKLSYAMMLGGVEQFKFIKKEHKDLIPSNRVTYQGVCAAAAHHKIPIGVAQNCYKKLITILNSDDKKVIEIPIIL